MSNVLGYGSLINPLSLVGRHVDSTIDETYEQDKRLFDTIDDPAAERAWQRHSDTITCHPVKVPGYKRYYSIKHRGGGMLEIYPADDHYINAILYTSVPDPIHDSVTASEEAYTEETLTDDDLIPYTPPLDVPKSTTNVYIPESNAPDTGVQRHPVYHDRLLESILTLIDEGVMTPDTAREFALDFLQTTHEYDSDRDEWRTLHDKDGRKDIHRLARRADELNIPF